MSTGYILKATLFEVWNQLKLLRASIKNQSLSILVILYGITLPTQLGKHFWPEFSYIHGVRIDYLAPSVYLFDLVCLLIICLHLRKTLSQKPTLLNLVKPKLIRNGITIIFFVVANIIFSIQPELTTLKILKFTIYITAGYIVSYFSLNNRWRPLASGFLISTSLVFLLALLQLLSRSSMGGIWYLLGERAISISLPSIAKMSIDGHELLRPYSTFSHPNSMGGFYLVLYFLVGWIEKSRKYTTFGWLANTTKLLSLGIMIVSFSRSVIFAFALISTWDFLRSKTYKSCFVCLVARISILLFLISFIFMFSGDPSSLSKRIFLAKQAIEISKDSMMTGTGVATNILAKSRLSNALPGSQTDTLQPVHNIFLLWFSETGVLGVAFLITIFWNTRLLFRNAIYLPWGALFGVVITGMFDHYWMTLAQNVALLGLILAISIHTLKSDGQLELPLWKP